MKNMGASVQARLKNLSREVELDVPSLLRRYVQERLLYRLSVSDEAQNFVLKGGLLMAAYNGGDLMRPTEDIDFSGVTIEGNVDRLRVALHKVLSIEVPDDGVEFLLDTMTVKKDRTGIVPGGKIVLFAKVGTSRVELRVDVGFGNPVTPSVQLIEFPTLLAGNSPRPIMNAYPLETVIAEKLHAMAQFGAINTRLKDYYDIWMLTKLHEFDGDLISDAIENTFIHQERKIPTEFVGLSQSFIDGNKAKWAGFLSKLPGKPDYNFQEVVTNVRDFVQPMTIDAIDGVRSGLKWEPGEGWRQTRNYAFN